MTTSQPKRTLEEALDGPKRDFYDGFDGQKRQPVARATAVAAPTSYGAKALAGEVERVRAVAIGNGRNDALNIAAFRMGQLVAAGTLDEQTVIGALGDADGGLDYPATAATIRSGLDAGMAQARLISDRSATDSRNSEDPFSFSYTAPAVGTAVVEEPSASTWAGVDLGPFLDGTRETVTADLMARTDGVCLLYPGAVHSFHGESESGKSLLLQLLAAELINDGEPVLFVDFESDPASIIDRMRTLGATDDAIRLHFQYVQPEVRPDATRADRQAWTAMLGGSYRLAIIDGVTDALSVFGYATKENDDITTWMRAVPKMIATQTGAAVAIIDHVTKDAESRGRFAIGGQAKMAGLTGAAYAVSIIDPLGRGMRGTIGLRIGKDRPGTVRLHCGPYRKSDRTQEAARVVVDSTGDGPTTWVIQPWQEPGVGASGATFRPTTLMERVSRFVEVNPESSGRTIRDRVTGKERSVLDALALLVEEGHLAVTDGVRGKLHTVARSYVASMDPKSDLNRGGTGQRPDDLSNVA